MSPNEETSASSPEPVLDVERIVRELQERVAQRRARGEYDDPGLQGHFSMAPGGIALRPEVAYSAKPFVGPAITRLKQTLIRLQFHFLNDMATQMNSALAVANSRLDAEIARRAELEARIEHLERRLDLTTPASGDPEPGKRH